MKAFLILVLSFALITFVGSYSFGSGPDIGEDAPDFMLKGMDGKETKLSDFKSVKSVVLIFGSCT